MDIGNYWWNIGNLLEWNNGQNETSHQKYIYQCINLNEKYSMLSLKFMSEILISKSLQKNILYDVLIDL